MIDFDILTLLILTVLFVALILILPKKEKEYYLYAVMFFCYISMVISLTLFPMVLMEAQDEVHISASIHLVPFSYGIGKTDIYNILLFIPMGILIPFVFRKTNTLVKTGLVCLSISALIETLQLLEVSGVLHVVAFRVVDINDIICNTLGGALGYCLLLLLAVIFSKKFSKATSKFFLFMAKTLGECKLI